MKLDSCPKCATFWTFRWNLILNVVHKLWNILNPVLGLKSICQTSTSTLLSSEGHSVVSNSLRLHRLYSPWNSPGQNTGVGILSLLQVIFLTQGSNPGLPHYRQILYQLSHKGSLIFFFLSNELLKVMIGLSAFFFQMGVISPWNLLVDFFKNRKNIKIM